MEISTLIEPRFGYRNEEPTLGRGTVLGDTKESTKYKYMNSTSSIPTLVKGSTIILAKRDIHISTLLLHTLKTASKFSNQKMVDNIIECIKFEKVGEFQRYIHHFVTLKCVASFIKQKLAKAIMPKTYISPFFMDVNGPT